jgi:hypothetical protein
VRTRLIPAALALLLATPWPAAAHLGLSWPPSRHGADVLKDGPCGVAGSQRGEVVTVLEPGTQLDLVWDEYIDHPGHFRVAFDGEGDDDFVDPPCLSGCRSRQPVIELYSTAGVLLDGIADTPSGGPGGVRVTLPDIECEGCTLQVIQVMYDKPPYALPGNDIYYQCADLALRRPALPACPGDCDGDRRVSISELTLAVRIALALDPIDRCAAGDPGLDGRVTVDELVLAVASAMLGCATADQAP